MGYYSELDISKHENELDIIMRDKIKEYEAENGEYDFYGFRNGEIYGVSKEELMKELEEVGERIINGEEECYTLDELDEMLKKIINTSNDLINKSNDLKINIKENENGD